jgi:hypothetical protein
MIPDFRDGRLPPGVHGATLEELRDKLGWGQRRKNLINGLEMALRLMGNCGIERVYLDGSFVTDKDRPGDIDGCYDVPPDANLGAMYPIWSLTPANRDMSKAMFGVELFPSRAPATPSGEPFISFFQEDRDGNRRGIVSMDL